MVLYAVKSHRIDLFNQIIELSSGDVSDLLTQTNRYGQSVILTAIDNDDFEVINKCIASHININPDRNNGYSIIKLLADKAEEVDPDIAISYLQAINKIFTEYVPHELNLYAKDGKDKDLLVVLYKQYSKNSLDQDLYGQVELAIANCYRCDIDSTALNYFSKKNANEIAVANKILYGGDLEGEDIQSFGSAFKDRNKIFQLKLLKDLRSGDQSLFQSLIDLHDNSLNIALCKLVKLEYVDKPLLTRLITETSFTPREQNKKIIDKILKQYFSTEEAASISIQWRAIDSSQETTVQLINEAAISAAVVVDNSSSVLSSIDMSEKIKAFHKAFANRDKENGYARISSVLSGMDEDTKLNLLNQYKYADNGNRSLHILAEEGNKKLSDLLIENGADPTIKNYANETPSEVAKRAAKGVYIASFVSKTNYQNYLDTSHYLKEQEDKFVAGDNISKDKSHIIKRESSFTKRISAAREEQKQSVLRR